jgi:hypothetical protein
MIVARTANADPDDLITPDFLKDAWRAGVRPANFGETPKISDLHKTLDDLHREYIKERNAIADQFIQGTRIKAAGGKRPLQRIEETRRGLETARKLQKNPSTAQKASEIEQQLLELE